MTNILSIFGASVRAAVQSARRAGLETFAVDLFADADTQACSPALRISRYPAGFLPAAAQTPTGPWMYTGGLENHPEIVRAIAREKPLWGNHAEILRRVRDPFAVYAALARAGLPALEVRRNRQRSEVPQRWLVKPYASCGGKEIEFDDDSARMASTTKRPLRAGLRRSHYRQLYRSGRPAAAVFVASAGEASLWGVTRQLIGVDWAGAAGFRYCGSIGPLRLARSLTEQIERVGQALTRQFNLCGLFGVDGVIDQEQFWTVEVNPRYTASIEILERAGCGSAIALHAAACGFSLTTVGGDSGCVSPAANRQFGKLVVFAKSNVHISPRFMHLATDLNAGADSALADIPHVNEQIPAEHPIATVLAAGSDEDEVLAKLRRQADLVYAATRNPFPRQPKRGANPIASGEDDSSALECRLDLDGRDFRRNLKSRKY